MAGASDTASENIQATVLAAIAAQSAGVGAAKAATTTSSLLTQTVEERAAKTRQAIAGAGWAVGSNLLPCIHIAMHC